MNDPGLYVKRPIVYRAIQWTGKNLEAIRGFVGGDVQSLQGILYVKNGNGRLPVESSQWIVDEELGVFSIYTNDQFEHYFEPIDPNEPR